MSSIEDAIETAGFAAFADSLRASPYGETLDSGGPFTIFAPDDAAFARFSPEALDRLHDDEALLRAVVGYHFAAGKVMAARFAGKRIRAVMYAGGDVVIDGKTTGLRVNGVKLTKPDITAGACVIHGIDAVLWPREPAAAQL